MTANELKKYLVEQIISKAAELDQRIDEVSDDFDLTGSGIFDSMDFMNLLVKIENKFAIEIDLSDADPVEFTKVAGFVAAIVKK